MIPFVLIGSQALAISFSVPVHLYQANADEFKSYMYVTGFYLFLFVLSASIELYLVVSLFQHLR